MSSPSLHPPMRVHSPEDNAEVAKYTKRLLCMVSEKFQVAIIDMEYPYKDIRWFKIRYSFTMLSEGGERFSEDIDGIQINGHIMAVDGSLFD